MAYQVLARKYRPQTFDDIIGQSHVATTLINALRQQKVAHAYIFTGPRGVGKTTTARILAKALNCVQGPTPAPCNACDPCQRIAQGQEMVDVLEIDAASNRGIEEIRALRENVRYAPARSRFKVYIVDEAHQITHDAFNAFLKTLEEPPEHAVFILATTEHQRIPATILSRCQLFRFKRVSEPDITGRLQKILAQEKLAVEPAALARLARAAGGSVRDALSLLDQALAYTTGSLTAQQVELLLGFLPEEFLEGFAGALLRHDPVEVLGWVRRLSDEGWELPQFVRDLREWLRRAMVDQLAGGVRPEALKMAGETAALSALLQLIRVLGQCLDEMRWNDNPVLVLELYSLRLTQPFVEAGALLERLERLERQIPAGGGPPAAPGPARPAPVSAPARSVSSPSGATARPPAPASRPPAPVVPPPAPQAVAPAAAAPAVPAGLADESPAARDRVAAQWKQLLSELWKKPTVASHMERARLKSATATEWTLSFPDAFALECVQRGQAFVAETLARLAGHPVALRLVHEPRAAEAVENEDEEDSIIAAPVAEEQLAAAAQDEKVQKILKVFKGKIRLQEPEDPA